jgi:hypothetical protein
MEGNKFITHEAAAESFSVHSVKFTHGVEFTALSADGRTADGVIDGGRWIITFVDGRTVRSDSAVATRIADEAKEAWEKSAGAWPG